VPRRPASKFTDQVLEHHVEAHNGVPSRAGAHPTLLQSCLIVRGHRPVNLKMKSWLRR
jgi:hypothetical protein